MKTRRPYEAEQEAIREMIALRAQGMALRVIAAEVQAKGHRISRLGVSDVLRAVAELKLGDEDGTSEPHAGSDEHDARATGDLGYKRQ